MDNKELLKEKQSVEARLKELQKMMKGAGNSLVLEALNPVFEKFPELLAVRWHQYTPYFDDGDSCTFSSKHDAYPEFQTEEDGEFKETDERFEKATIAALKVFTDDDMLSFFDDHSEITVKRDGTIEVEEYDHE